MINLCYFVIAAIFQESKILLVGLWYFHLKPFGFPAQMKDEL